ncbi:hypothetical protein HZH68_001683 [Vespula germanica]|uniref:Uncharacterized protein n=1 Tax=Vespula germanica TaxID=30212 RepID=A0A834NW16_VESGE|nr:hypothetical protein HZH68_001683 [Vespula germanica]
MKGKGIECRSEIEEEDGGEEEEVKEEEEEEEEEEDEEKNRRTTNIDETREDSFPLSHPTAHSRRSSRPEINYHLKSPKAFYPAAISCDQKRGMSDEYDDNNDDDDNDDDDDDDERKTAEYFP